MRLRPFGARSCSIDSSPMVAVWDNCFGEHNALATLIAGFSLLEVRISIESKLLVLVMDSLKRDWFLIGCIENWCFCLPKEEDGVADPGYGRGCLSFNEIAVLR